MADNNSNCAGCNGRVRRVSGGWYHSVAATNPTAPHFAKPSRELTPESDLAPVFSEHNGSLTARCKVPGCDLELMQLVRGAEWFHVVDEGVIVQHSPKVDTFTIEVAPAPEASEEIDRNEKAFLVDPTMPALVNPAVYSGIMSLESTTGQEIDPEGINHPAHYNSHPSGVECIQIIRHHTSNVGMAIKYLWRAGLKLEAGKDAKAMEIKDLKKAVFYLNDEIKRLEGN